MRILIALLLTAAAPALAEPIVSVGADLNGDGLADRAELVMTDKGGMADLLIFIGRRDGSQSLYATAREYVWVGGIGQQPELSTTARGSLQVVSMNEAIGRDRWRQTLTVAWRDGAFVLAGITYSWYDTLDLANAGTCDVNLLTGKGELTKRGENSDVVTSFQTTPHRIPVQSPNWEFPKECGLW
jgi:hypothetical protein